MMGAVPAQAHALQPLANVAPLVPLPRTWIPHPVRFLLLRSLAL